MAAAKGMETVRRRALSAGLMLACVDGPGTVLSTESRRMLERAIEVVAGLGR
jgi:hypothetical protein